MTQEQKNNPLHGIKLEDLLNELVDNFGWNTLANEINLNCFKSNPSIKSSLKFLRRTEWAREKVERFYLYDHKKLPRPGEDQYDIPPRKRTVSPSTKTTTNEQDKNISEKPRLRSGDNRPKNTPREASTGKFNPWETSRHNED